MMRSIQLGDCLELMKDIPDGSVDMILADLPYGTTQNKWDSVLPLDLLWQNYSRILTENGCVVLTTDGIFTGVLMMSNPKWFKYKLIWDKKSTTGFLNAKKMPLRRHEDILVFAKGKTTYNPTMEVRGKPRNKGSYNKKKGDGDMCYGAFKNITSFNNEYYPTSIIEISNANQKTKQHPTQKPVALFEYLIKTYTNEGDLVLDNVAGSGTTAIACLNTNRQFIVMEKEQKYFDIIMERVRQWL
jgi:site-specific DNA-methyltransferase (adenine-specific)